MISENEFPRYQRALRSDREADKILPLLTLTHTLLDEIDPQEKDKVLDVGTGTGRVALLLVDMIPKGLVVGLDADYVRLVAARQKISEAKIGNFLIVQGRAEALPFPAQTFDSACSMFALHHFTNPGQAVTEIHRILKAGGRLVTIDPVLKDMADEDDLKLRGYIEGAFQLAHGGDFRFFTAQEIRELYQKAGFSIELLEQRFLFHEEKLEGIPMGPHWLDAYNLMSSQREGRLLKKFEKDYFSFMQEKDTLLVEGEMRYVIIKATKGTP